ncbi:Ubiquitin domain-containing protein 7SL RNA1 [Cardamine amara subsp. amara]|uniref:Ubiquitin domain-containing protein 7SL RNA1 n=1 Tax=Cardamine amara subsp. amara TaxID=228776 RepID=A0ABD1AYD4_CARAN
MDVFVDSIGLPSFSIEVGLWDTVLAIKQKIEKSQGFLVSRQVIFFKGKVLHNHFDVTECDIMQNSRLKLFFSPSDNTNQNNDQVLPPQTEQPSSSSAVSANPIEEFAKATQSWPLVRRNNDQVLQTEEPQVTLNSSNEFLGIQESPVMVASDSVEETIYGQDSSVMVRSDYDESRSLREIEKLLSVEDNLPPVKVGSSSNTNQPLASDKGKEIIEIPDSPDSPVKKKIKANPRKMIVMVMSFKETWTIPVEVNADDNVEELRNELVKMEERGLINLPRVRYVFIHNQARLFEDQSFQSNKVADGDTIEIMHGYMGSLGGH